MLTQYGLNIKDVILNVHANYFPLAEKILCIPVIFNK